MSRRYRGSGVQQHSRLYHRPQQYQSLEFDNTSDVVYWDYNFQHGYPANSNSAYLWRLPGTRKFTNGGSSTEVFENKNAAYGETAQSVAFWVKPLHGWSIYGQHTNNIPVEHPSDPNKNTWRPIWKSNE